MGADGKREAAAVPGQGEPSRRNRPACPPPGHPLAPAAGLGPPERLLVQVAADRPGGGERPAVPRLKRSSVPRFKWIQNCFSKILPVQRQKENSRRGHGRARSHVSGFFPGSFPAPARPALPSPDPASPHLSLTGAGAVPGSQGQHHTSPSHTWQIPCAGLRSRERSFVAQLNWGPRKRRGGGTHSFSPPT